MRPLGEEPPLDARADLAKAIPRRAQVSWWLGLVFAGVFALLVTPAITAERWLGSLGIGGTVMRDQPVAYTIRVPPFAGQDAGDHHIGNGGVFLARGQKPDRDQAFVANEIVKSRPGGPLPYAAFFVLVFVCAAIFTHHLRRSNKGRLVRVQLVSLVTLALLAAVVKLVMLATSLSILVVPVAMLAIVPTMALDRIVGLATGVLGALVVSLLVPFDVGVAILLLVQASVAGLVIAEQPKVRWRTVLTTGAVTVVITTGTYVLMKYLTTGAMPAFGADSSWLAAAIGPAIALVAALPLLPIYQLLVGEITRGKLIELEDLSHPLLRQIAEKSPGTWQHSLMMANMAEIAANAIGANGRLVRVGAYFHDLGKSLAPKYFIENLEPGEQSPHDKLPPEVSCDVIFAHVSEGVQAARRAGLHERIIDFQHMHHGNGVLEYFWGKTREQGNPRHLSIEKFRYPGHPPQSRETAILAICDAVEAASRTLKKPDPAAIDSLVQRIVYGKLHLGQLDESGLSMSDLRRVADSLRETIRHANHGRIEYPWQKAQQDASASLAEPSASTSTSPRLDSLDRKPHRDTGMRPAIDVAAALARDRSGDARSSQEDVITQPRTLPAGSGRHSGVQKDVEIQSVDHSEPGEVLELVPRGQESSSATPIPDAKESLRSSVPAQPPPEVIGPATFDARRSAAQLPAPVAPRQKPPTMPQQPKLAATPMRSSGLADDDDAKPTDPADLAVTKPPRSQRGTKSTAQPIRTHVGPMPGPRDGLHDASTQPPTNKPPRPPPGAPERTHVGPVAGPSLTGDSSERLRAPSTQVGLTAAVPPSASNRVYVGPPAPEIQDPTGPPRPPPGHPARTEPPPMSDDLDGPTTSNRIYMGPPADASDSLEEDALANPPPPPRRTAMTPQPGRMAGPPPKQDLENAITNPPPFRRRPSDGPITSLPGLIAEAAHQVTADLEERVTGERRAIGPVEDNARTEPSMPRFELPLRAPPSLPPPAKHVWAEGLAERVDKVLGDEWSPETPVVPPSPAELRSLLGAPDPTRKQSLDELEALHRAASEVPSEPDILNPRNRPKGKTAEVDPDDIEAAIEIAPPARKPTGNSIAVAKPKKPE